MLKAVHVTAVVVSHDGGNYLPRTLAALLDQTRPADAAIGIDTGSRDKSAALLQRALGKDNVTGTGEHKAGFGAAVMAGLARSAPPSREPGAVEWIWLLHDDAAPAPDALAELLQAVERAPSVTVAGCKQLSWNAERRLVDAGLSTSRWAERLTLIEADELDQGQYDGRTDTFAVNSAGMLIRRDAWEQLGGFDPALPGVGDDVDFCWRNWLAGNRVVVVPAARMFHVENRPHSLATPAAARKSQVHLRLTHASPWKVPLHALGALLGSMVRLVLSILVKEPGHGISQLGATVAALGRPGAIWRSRRNAARTRRVPRSMVKGLQTPRREVWAHRRSLVEAIGADEFQETDSLAPEPSGDAGDDFVALATNERGWIGTGAVAAAFVALAASIVGLLGLLGANGVTGGGLLPLSAAGDIWRSACTWWIGLGAGLPGHGDPFAYILWLVSLLGGSDSSTAIVWLLLLAMPLSGLGAWFAAGAMTSLRRYRFMAALIWAAAPALQVAVNQGRAGALLAHVVMPLLVLALFRATGSALGRGTTLDQAQQSGRAATRPLPGKPGVNGTPSWTAAAAAGLALAVVTASAPSLFPPFAVLIVFCGIALGRRGRTIWWSLLPSAALFLPYVLSALERPRTMLADPGVPLGFEAAPLWQQLLGQPLKFDVNGGLAGLALFGPSGIPWALALALLIGAPVLLLSIAALFVPGGRSRVTRFLWAGALVLLAWAWLAGHVATGVDGNLLVAPFTGPAVSAAGFAFLGAALIGADNLLHLKAKAEDGRPVQRAAVRIVSAVATLLLIAGPLASMGLWATQNVLAGPDSPPSASGALGTPRMVQPAGPGTLPATAVDHGQGPEQTRTLVITAGENGGYTSSFMRGAGTTLDSLSTVAAGRSIVGSPGQERLVADDDATASIRNAVATIVAGTGVDPRPALEQLGAGFVVLKSADTAAPLTANRIDSVPGLVAVGKTDSGWLWRVTPLNQAAAADAETAHRVRVVDAKGAVVALLPSVGSSATGNIPAGGDGRLVVLAERADAGWSAWLDGRQLSPTTSGWAQAFTLPSAGGQIEIRYTTVWEPWLSILQAVVIGLTVLLAIPMPARRPKAGLLKEQNSLRKEYSSV
ncbi:glycosyltransferase family 2 protein [Arthrobacter bambusae]|uniref:glycosyltransferase family 2 protein n=1 Tax=Arthrobacter bambusae TaxID=1338426 RepID=UPI0027D89839|nr:glycosyltransferase family 2 protein [Arthrobacter bambusae]